MLTFGFPEAQARFDTGYTHFVQEVLRLQPLIEGTLKREETKKTAPLDAIIFVMGAAVHKDFQEIFVLAANGLSIGAVKVLRGMYEKVVTLVYLDKHPEEAQSFIDYDAVHRHKLLNRLPEDIKLSSLGEETIRSIEEQYQRSRERFTITICDCGKRGLQHSWTRLDTFSMAKNAGDDLAQAYGPAFLLPTLHVHTTMADVAKRTICENGQTKLRADAEIDSPSTLLHSHLLLMRMLQLHNSHFDLGFDSELKRATQEFETCRRDKTR